MNSAEGFALHCMVVVRPYWCLVYIHHTTKSAVLLMTLQFSTMSPLAKQGVVHTQQEE